jgi:hypothetical protein
MIEVLDCSPLSTLEPRNVVAMLQAGWRLPMTSGSGVSDTEPAWGTARPSASSRS